MNHRSIAPNAGSTPTVTMSRLLHVDLDDLAHPQDTDAHQYDPAADHDLPDRDFEELVDVSGVHDRDVAGEDERKGDQDDRRQTSFRRKDLDLPADHLSFAERVGDGRKQRREVTADLALDVDCEDDPPEVFTAHTIGHRVE